MTKRKMRVVAAPALLRRMGVVAALLIAVGLVLASAMMVIPAEFKGARLDAAKSVLQFLFVTGAGGILVALLAEMRDQTRRSEEQQTASTSALQSLDRELGSAYRALKMVKRQLRGQLILATRDGNGRPAPPYEFQADNFRASMRELLEAQILAEGVREHVSMRHDLFDEPATAAELYEPLRYLTRFFHDVHQDLENGRVLFQQDRCVVTAECRNIDGLLNGTNLPSDLPKEVQQALDRYRRIAGSGIVDLISWREAFDAVDGARKHDPCRRRFRFIADDCFVYVSSRIRVAVADDAPLVPPSRSHGLG